LLHGEQDTTIPPSDAYRLHAQAPAHSTLIVMPDADHNSIEALEGVTPAVLSFLRSADVTGTARPN
ncbi:MAG: alpha/beta hydrolase, partial [Candidatus Microthrix sp.]|nr:alpha/beta hydrolase [Candidatus Microthrix sp.]